MRKRRLDIADGLAMLASFALIILIVLALAGTMRTKRRARGEQRLTPVPTTPTTPAPQPSKKIVIYLEEQRLEALEEGQVARSFSATTDRYQPEGEYKVGGKKFETVIPSMNEKGQETRWSMGSMIFLEDSEGRILSPSIHGVPLDIVDNKLVATEPGRCVHLQRDEAKELYRWTPIGIPVEVRSSRQSVRKRIAGFCFT